MAKEHKYDKIPAVLKNQMANIVWSFSPENLTCDGELTQKEIDSKVKDLSQRWATLTVSCKSLHQIDVDFDEFEEYLYSR